MTRNQTHQADPSGEDFIPVAERRIGSWRLSLHRQALSRRQIRRTYNAQASGWNRALRALGTEAAYRAVCAAFAQKLTTLVPEKTLQILDAGSGTGALSSAFIASCKAPVRLHALDASPHMLAEAQRTYACDGLKALLHLGDICGLPFESGSMDVVLTAHVLEHLADPQRALTELMRVLRPGGWILLIGTKASPVSLPIQMLWRTHGFAPNELEARIRDAGATHVERLKPVPMPLFNQLSLTFLARKPLNHSPTDQL